MVTSSSQVVDCRIRDLEEKVNSLEKELAHERSQHEHLKADFDRLVATKIILATRTSIELERLRKRVRHLMDELYCDDLDSCVSDETNNEDPFGHCPDLPRERSSEDILGHVNEEKQRLSPKDFLSIKLPPHVPPKPSSAPVTSRFPHQPSNSLHAQKFPTIKQRHLSIPGTRPPELYNHERRASTSQLMTVMLSGFRPVGGSLSRVTYVPQAARTTASSTNTTTPNTESFSSFHTTPTANPQPFGDVGGLQLGDRIVLGTRQTGVVCFLGGKKQAALSPPAPPDLPDLTRTSLSVSPNTATEYMRAADEDVFGLKKMTQKLTPALERDESMQSEGSDVSAQSTKSNPSRRRKRRKSRSRSRSRSSGSRSRSSSGRSLSRSRSPHRYEISEMIGVMLDFPCKEAGDGSYNGVRYFNAKQGYGLFVHKRSQFFAFRDPMSGFKTGEFAQSGKRPALSAVAVAEAPSDYPEFDIATYNDHITKTLKTGDHVLLNTGQSGIVQFIDRDTISIVLDEIPYKHKAFRARHSNASVMSHGSQIEAALAERFSDFEKPIFPDRTSKSKVIHTPRHSITRILDV